jgi:3-oxoadipate enol-lactonase
MPFFTSDGIKLHYEEHGRGEPLVLVPGMGMDTSMWSEQLDVYKRYFRTILLDLRGGGQSEVPEPGYTPADLAEDTVSLLDHLEIERAHFGGFSLGGAAGLELAIAHPERLRSLSLHSSWEATQPYPHFRRWLDLRGRIIAQNDPVVNVGTRIISFFSPEFVNAREDRIELFIKRALANPYPMTPEGIAGHVQACLAHDVRGRLEGIKVPTLITVGTRDRSTLPAASEYLHRHIPGSEFVLVNGTGHCSMFEAAEEFTTISLGFLLKHASPAQEGMSA